MIFADLIREALTPAKPNGVPVRHHVRKKPSNPKREAVLEELRALQRKGAFVPTEGHERPAGHRVAS